MATTVSVLCKLLTLEPCPAFSDHSKNFFIGTHLTWYPFSVCMACVWPFYQPLYISGLGGAVGMVCPGNNF